MYTMIEKTALDTNALLVAIAEFAWDSEHLRVAFPGGLPLIDFGAEGLLSAETLSRLAARVRGRISPICRSDVPAGLSWLRLDPYSSEED